MTPFYLQNKCVQGGHVDIKMEIGCYADKLARTKGPDVLKLRCIRTYLHTLVPWVGAENQVVFGVS